MLGSPTPGLAAHLSARQTLAALLAAEVEAAHGVTCVVGHAPGQRPEHNDLGGPAQHPVGVVLVHGDPGLVVSVGDQVLNEDARRVLIEGNVTEMS